MKNLAYWLPRKLVGIALDIAFGPEEKWDGYPSTQPRCPTCKR